MDCIKRTQNHKSGSLLQRAPWAGLGSLLGQPAVAAALMLSLLFSVVAAAVILVFGTPLAWVLARVDIPDAMR